MPVSGRLLLDGRTFDDTFDFTVLTQFNAPDFRNAHLAVHESHILGDTKGIAAAFAALELGKPRSSLEEGDERFVQVHQRLLKHLAVTLFEEGRFGLLLELHEFRGKSVVTDAFAGLLVDGALSLQRPVPHEPTTSREPKELHLLFGGRLQSELEALGHNHAYSIPDKRALVLCRRLRRHCGRNRKPVAEGLHPHGKPMGFSALTVYKRNQVREQHPLS